MSLGRYRDLAVGIAVAQHPWLERGFGTDLRCWLQRATGVEKRLDAETLITTPNSGVIYAPGIADPVGATYCKAPA
jgi:hypothetical protein